MIKMTVQQDRVDGERRPPMKARPVSEVKPRKERLEKIKQEFPQTLEYLAR
jgi:hypothetical protein